MQNVGAYIARWVLLNVLRSAVAISRKLDKYYIAGVLFFMAVTLGVIFFGSNVYHRLSNAKLLPMTSILISGTRHHVSDQALQSALSKVPQSANFFTLDVKRVQQQIEALPWVREVRVRKQWPNKLRVYLQEQQPVAIWNHTQLLNRQGNVFDAPVSQVAQPLVKLNGPKEFIGEMIGAWHQMGKIVTTKSLHISEISLSDRRSWRLKLSNGIQLRLGQRDRMKRLQRFLNLYDQLHPEKMAYADLRYNNGLAIGWKQQQGS